MAKLRGNPLFQKFVSKVHLVCYQLLFILEPNVILGTAGERKKQEMKNN